MEHQEDHREDTLPTETTEARPQQRRWWLWALILVVLLSLGVALYVIYTAHTGESLEDELPLPDGFGLA